MFCHTHRVFFVPAHITAILYIIQRNIGSVFTWRVTVNYPTLKGGACERLSETKQ